MLTNAHTFSLRKKIICEPYNLSVREVFNRPFVVT